jgi:hypothetical protein
VPGRFRTTISALIICSTHIKHGRHRWTLQFPRESREFEKQLDVGQ